MNSIRRHLTIRLLTGLALLWLAAGTGVYFAVQQSLLKALDAELAVDARIVRFAVKGSSDDTSTTGGGKRLQDRMPSYDSPDGDAYFQSWNSQGTSTEKSVSLGTFDLPFPGAHVDTAPDFSTTRLDDGRAIRTMQFRSAGGKRKGKGRRTSGGGTIMMLGRDLTAIEATLQRVIGGIAFVGFVAALGAIVLVQISVNRGVRPLRKLAEQTREIDAESLDARFDSKGAPEELRPIYEHLNDLVHRLEDSFERERRFSADLAHEMRTPVAELQMINEVALKWQDQGGEKAHQDSLDIAYQLTSTIETLLALARCESGELSVQIAAVDMTDFIRECWSPFEREAEGKNLVTSFEVSKPPPVFQTDRKLFRHILSNLISNAVEYTPNGGSIEITAMENEVEIVNDVAGMEDSDLDHLFERYWRKDDARTSRSHAGLGLPLAKTLADALSLKLAARLMDGKIHFRIARP